MVLARHKDKQKLNDVYSQSNAPGSFGGVHALKRYSGRSEKDVKRFLSQRDAYTLHKPTRIRFFLVTKRILKVYAIFIRSIW